MIYNLDGNDYEVEIVKKGNKNTYVRVKEDLTIQVTTNFFASKSSIKELLDRNTNFLRTTISKREKEINKNESFYYLGKSYDIIELSTIDKIEFVDNKLYINDKKNIDKWLKKEMLRLFKERLDYNYSLFTEDIPYPSLKIRNMKTRWGVCNRKNLTVTLNSNLIKESIDKLDYVIIHELSHLVYFDHSKNFWSIVGKYCPKYKMIRKELRE
ncbi:MAG TPA: SprT family zinc-dependent metalloprotease [Bacilli bacterium]|nr:SprT family zinc-dependent metalloprotease [Bacilli bacterium]